MKTDFYGGKAVKKNITMIISIFICILLIGVFIFFSVFLAGNINEEKETRFSSDGYIVEKSNEESINKIRFGSDTAYKKNTETTYMFNDIANNEIIVEEDNFIYYDNNSISSFKRGVVVNLADIGTDSINHYGLLPFTILEKSGENYVVKESNENMVFEEFVWKLSEDKYLLSSAKNTLILSEDNTIELSNLVEINLVDQGVIEIVSGDKKYTSISPELNIQTAAGYAVFPIHRVVTKDDSILYLDKLMVNSNDNIEVTVKKNTLFTIPKFNISGVGGESGDQGIKGTGGTGGDNGQSGGRGPMGETGGSGSDSSITTALPAFTFENLILSADSIYGEIKVKDENALLNKDPLGSVKIIDIETGESINCVEYDKDSDLSGTVKFDFSSIVGTNRFLGFKNSKELKPDTKYRLVVSAFYTYNGKEYEREFISKNFYTDSMGVFIDTGTLGTNKASINLTKKDYSAATSATVYLLTTKQASEPFEITKDYMKQTVQLEAVGKEEKKTIEFKANPANKITPNTEYVVVLSLDFTSTSGANTSVVSEQRIKIKTLKEAPTTNDITKVVPIVLVNRKDGSFEMYPNVLVDDPNNAVVSLRYDVYSGDSVVKTIRTNGLDLNAQNLYVDYKTILPEINYRIKVVLEYFDNEKIVTLSTDFSDYFKLTGGTMPAVSFVADHENSNATAVVGNLIIDVTNSNNSKIEISAEKPLRIYIDAEGIFAKELTISNANQYIQQGKTIIIPINETSLKQDTIYRMSVTGYINLSDGADFAQKTLGQVVTSTPKLGRFDAKWSSVPGDTGKIISQKIKLEAPQGASEEEYKFYANLINKIDITLYSGSGVNKKQIATYTETDKNTENIYESSLKEMFYDNEVILNEDTFGVKGSSLTAENYTFEITTVYDYSVMNYNTGNISSYQNTFEIANNEKNVIKMKTPPALPPQNMQGNQVEAVGIMNSEAESFGVKMNPDLSDEAIIGFQLLARYDNYAQLARNITYYAFESNTFDNSIKAKVDPIENNLHTFSKNFVISTTKNEVPKVAFMFGDAPNDFIDGSYKNGTYVYYAGKLTGSNGSYKGMERGLKYVFAYQLQYSPTGTEGDLKVYPNEAPGIEQMAKPFILNSGMQSAAKQDAIFTSYLYKTNLSDAESGNGVVPMVIKYKYSDVDGVIPSNAAISVDGEIIGEIGAKNEWQKLVLSRIGQNTKIVPVVQRKLYHETYIGESTSAKITEQPYKPSFQMFSYSKDLRIELTENYDLNQITFEVTSTNNQALDKMMTNLIGLRATFKGLSNGATQTEYIELNTIGLGKIETSRLSKFLNQETEVKVQLIYDTDRTTWETSLLNEPANAMGFALQQITKNAEFGNYYVDADVSSEYALTSLFNGNMSLTDMTIKVTSGFDKRGFDRSLAQLDSGIAMKYATDYYSSKFIPKQVGYYDFVYSDTEDTNQYIGENGNKVKIDKLTPTMKITGKSLSFSTFNMNYRVSGHQMLDRSTMNNNTNDNIKSLFFEVKNKDGDVIKLIEKQVDARVNPGNYGISLYDLSINTYYSIEVYGLIDGQRVDLIDEDSDDARKILVEFITEQGVVLKTVSSNYINTSYYEKFLSFNYTMNQVIGFRIEYELSKYDQSGNKVLIATNDELINKYHMFEKIDTNSVNMFQVFKLYPGLNPMPPGEKYVITVNAVKEDTGEILGSTTVDYDFRILPPFPSVFMRAVPSNENNDYRIDYSLSISDLGKIIMGKEFPDTSKKESSEGNFLIRIYEISSDGKEVDITPSAVKNSTYYINAPLQNISVDKLKEKTAYRFVIYATMDSNYDKESELTGDKISIAEIENFDDIADKSPYIIYEDIVVTTDKFGVNLGTVQVSRSSNDKNKVQIEMVDASGLENITEIDYSIVHESGSQSFSKVIYSPEFIDVGKNYYYLPLEDDLTHSGRYNITISFKSGNEIIDKKSIIYFN